MEGRQDDVFGAIKDHLVGRGIEEEKITIDAELLNDLDLDSLDTVELTLALEERFGIEIPDRELEDLVTVGDAVELIGGKVAAGA